MCRFGDASPRGLCCTCFDEQPPRTMMLKTDDGGAGARAQQQLCGTGGSPLGTTRTFSLVGGRSPRLAGLRVVGADVVC